MARIYVSLGSNVRPAEHLRAGVETLRVRYGELELSPVYESESVGFVGDNFYNMVVGFATEDSVFELAQTLRAIEAEHGRVRSAQRFDTRTLDIDLLLYEDIVLADRDLELPRSEITCYAFVLRPLHDLAPQLRHPRIGRTMAELWAAFDDGSQALWPVEIQW